MATSESHSNIGGECVGAIYAATVIRLLDTVHREPPKAFLEAILRGGTRAASESRSSKNPLEQLDVLYSHILEASPNPPLSALWIHAIHLLKVWATSALDINLLLQIDAESSEADHVLGNLHSLIWIPPSSDQATMKYKFYHKSRRPAYSDREVVGSNLVDSDPPVRAWSLPMSSELSSQSLDFISSKFLIGAL